MTGSSQSQLPWLHQQPGSESSKLCAMSVTCAPSQESVRFHTLPLQLVNRINKNSSYYAWLGEQYYWLPHIVVMTPWKERPPMTHGWKWLFPLKSTLIPSRKVPIPRKVLETTKLIFPVTCSVLWLYYAKHFCPFKKSDKLGVKTVDYSHNKLPSKDYFHTAFGHFKKQS